MGLSKRLQQKKQRQETYKVIEPVFKGLTVKISEGVRDTMRDIFNIYSSYSAVDKEFYVVPYFTLAGDEASDGTKLEYVASGLYLPKQAQSTRTYCEIDEDTLRHNLENIPEGKKPVGWAHVHPFGAHKPSPSDTDRRNNITVLKSVMEYVHLKDYQQIQMRMDEVDRMLGDASGAITGRNPFSGEKYTVSVDLSRLKDMDLDPEQLKSILGALKVDSLNRFEPVKFAFAYSYIISGGNPKNKDYVYAEIQTARMENTSIKDFKLIERAPVEYVKLKDRFHIPKDELKDMVVEQMQIRRWWNLGTFKKRTYDNLREAEKEAYDLANEIGRKRKQDPHYEMEVDKLTSAMKEINRNVKGTEGGTAYFVTKRNLFFLPTKEEKEEKKKPLFTDDGESFSLIDIICDTDYERLGEQTKERALRLYRRASGFLENIFNSSKHLVGAEDPLTKSATDYLEGNEPGAKSKDQAGAESEKQNKESKPEVIDLVEEVKEVKEEVKSEKPEERIQRLEEDFFNKIDQRIGKDKK